MTCFFVLLRYQPRVYTTVDVTKTLSQIEAKWILQVEFHTPTWFECWVWFVCICFNTLESVTVILSHMLVLHTAVGELCLSMKQSTLAEIKNLSWHYKVVKACYYTRKNWSFARCTRSGYGKFCAILLCFCIILCIRVFNLQLDCIMIVSLIVVSH